MNPDPLDEIRKLIANDAYACTFQTMGQYRAALLKAMQTVSTVYSKAQTFATEGDMYEAITGHRSAPIDEREKK